MKEDTAGDLIQTERLSLRPLDSTDAEFIIDLLNTPGWIRFIGDRHVHTEQDANAYIGKVINSPKLTYWVASSRSGNQPLGIITVIEREYLPGPDLGFAFLPAHAGQGYACEASLAVMQQLAHLKEIYAVTIPENESSIRLLKHLGFSHLRTLNQNDNLLELYVKYL